ncbi:MAG: hypothetical protein IT531_03305 [Burkholderiales bacterium]|nr:hypothetical protein [Burkholderiales bacterium]
MASASAPIDYDPNAHIYCHVCKSIQPLVVDEPQPGDGGEFEAATDLVCGACQFIVATTYMARTGPRDCPRAG